MQTLRLQTIPTLTKPNLLSHFIKGPRTTALKMSTGIPQNPTGLHIESPAPRTAPGITLTPNQTTLVSSVLDLFAGRPSLAKLALWRDDATFTDPLTIATGRERYSAQWYGLQQAFREIERLDHCVTNAGNPILMDLKTRYVVKGIGKEQVISSVVAVHVDESTGKIEKVEDRWDGKLPDGPITNAFRHLNAVAVPKVVSVPKNEEEDKKMGN